MFAEVYVGCPTVKAEAEIAGQYVIECPYCGKKHRHGAQEGHRVAHCDKGQAKPAEIDGQVYPVTAGYVILKPD
jgi:hypothetical protein